MSPSPTLFALVAIASLAIAIGCGGSEDSASQAPILSKAEFVEEASAACRRENAGLQPDVSWFLEQRSPKGNLSKDVTTDLVHFVLVPAIEVQISRIEQLIANPGVSAREAERIDELLDFERYAIDESATTLEFQSPKAVYRKFAESARLFRRYGLPACANGPKAPVPLEF